MADKTADDLGPEHIGRNVRIQVFAGEKYDANRPGKYAGGDVDYVYDPDDVGIMIWVAEGTLTGLGKGWQLAVSESGDSTSVDVVLVVVQLNDSEDGVELASDDRVWFT